MRPASRPGLGTAFRESRPAGPQFGERHGKLDHLARDVELRLRAAPFPILTGRARRSPASSAISASSGRGGAIDADERPRSGFDDHAPYEGSERGPASGRPEPEHRQRRQRRVTQPAISVVPGAAGPGPLRKRRGRGGDDASIALPQTEQHRRCRLEETVEMRAARMRLWNTGIASCHADSVVAIDGARCATPAVARVTAAGLPGCTLNSERVPPGCGCHSDGAWMATSAPPSSSSTLPNARNEPRVPGQSGAVTVTATSTIVALGTAASESTAGLRRGRVRLQ